jgi:hypothetical protein
LRNEKSATIQEQNGWFFFPNGFYHLCAPGQTARAVVTSRFTRINGPLYKAGEKDGDGPAALGERGNRNADDEYKTQHERMEKTFQYNPLRKPIDFL